MAGVAVFVFGLLVGAVRAQPPIIAPPLFLDVPGTVGGTTATGPSGRRYRAAGLDVPQLRAARDDVFSAGTARLTLNLFADAVLSAVLERVEPTDAGYVLSGRLAGDPLSSVVLAVYGEVIAGSVRAPGVPANYSIRPAGAGMVAIREIDPSAQPQGNDAVRPPADPPSPSGGVEPLRAPPTRPDVSQAHPGGDNGASIDLLVAFTRAARDEAGGVNAIMGLINLMVAETNLAFADSSVIPRVRLKAGQQTDYVEAWGRIGTDLDRLRVPDDGYLDWVHGARDRVRADIVVLIVRFVGGDAPGRAYVHADASSAFAVVAIGDWGYQGGADGATFAHELGHVMGLNHDRYEERVCSWCDPSDRRVDLSRYPVPYAFGFVNQRGLARGAPPGSRWRTVMAYNTQCGIWNPCEQLLRFANPDQYHRGDPLGVPGSRPSSSVFGPADARRRLNERRHEVANFRVASCLRGGAAVRLQSRDGRYVRASNNGGGAVYLDGRSGSTFTLVDRNRGPCVTRGDAVSFRTSDGFYLRASLGGTRGVDARGTNAGPWERFVIRSEEGRQIRTGDDITLRALTRHYVSPHHGGLRADERTAGPAETFRITLSGR